MTALAQMLTETATRLVQDFANTPDPRKLTEAMCEAGLTRPFSQSEGELDWEDAAGILVALGANAPFAAPADAIAADYVATLHGFQIPASMTLCGDRLDLAADQSVSGTARSITTVSPDTMLVANVLGETVNAHLVVVSAAQAAATDSVSISGERRSTLIFGRCPIVEWAKTDSNDDICLLTGALSRALLISGAVSRVLALTVEHCRTRKQFGRPLIAFQALQQQVAVLAAEQAASAAASRLAARKFGSRHGPLLIAAARVRTARAAQIATDIAHQCHGAIGFTEEYALQRFTRAMMAWRLEFGGEHYWAERLGRALACERDRDTFWRLAVRASGERQLA